MFGALRPTLRITLAAALLLTLALMTQQSTAAATTTVAVGDIWFCNETFEGGVCETTINVGDTVVWDFAGAKLPHTTTTCGDSCDEPTETPRWDSALINDGTTFEYQFNEPGTFLYFCAVHPFLQRGIMHVQGSAATDTPEPPTSTPVPPTATTPLPSPTPAGQGGDVNCNGNVDAIDAAFLLQLIAGLIDELPCPENADTNEDGMVNTIDAALILQFSAGFLVSLPP